MTKAIKTRDAVAGVGERLVTPLAIAGFLALVSIHVAVAVLGARANEMSTAWERGLIKSSVDGKFASYLLSWSELLSRVDPKSPPQPQASGRTLVIAPDGRVISILSDPAAPAAPDWQVAHAARTAVAALQTATARAPMRVPIGTAVVWIGGRPQLVVAARSEAVNGPAPIVVSTTDLDDYLTEFAQLRGLRKASVVRVGETPEGLTALPLPIPGQSNLVALAWAPRRLGQETIAPLTPFLWLVTLLALVGGALMVRHGRGLARSLVASRAHAQHLALHDPLTGLANRTLFTDRLDHALDLRRRSGDAVAVICVDLDRFKQVNDTLGHQVGDEMIREASRRILAVIRTSDTVARLGGDEFAIVLAPLSGRAAAETACARLVAALNDRLEFDAGQAAMSASIGVTVIEDSRILGADAIRQADLALYAAKNGGRGRFTVFEPEMDEGARLRHDIEKDLRAALAAGDLRVHYQPQLNARGQLDAVEALVRWTHPTRGAVSPAVFVAIAEETGLIHDLGDFVLRQALTDIHRWPNLRMAINVSPVQLRRGDFLQRFCAVLDACDVDPRRVEVEITEGVLLDNDARTKTVLKQLRELGVTLALDDFGTGYSSLSYLNAYPVDKIKIDRSFVSPLGSEKEAEKVVRAIVQLGHALGLKVTAEGVETAEQQARLLSAGCTSFQGFLFSKPVAAREIDDLLPVKPKPRRAA